MLPPRTDDLPTVSVVIPALDEELTITRCLHALSRTPDPPEEIVIVDNGCSDRTVHLARTFDRVRIVQEPRRGITFARSTGFDAARGDVVARIDADSEVASDWLHRIRDRFAREPDLDAIGGDAAISELSPADRLWFRWWYRGFRAWHQRSIGVQPMLYGFNCAFRRTAWQSARHLTGTDDLRVTDDLDVTIALLRTGHTLRHDPAIIVKARLFRSIQREKLRQYYLSDGLTLARHGVGNPRRWVTPLTTASRR